MRVPAFFWFDEETGDGGFFETKEELDQFVIDEAENVYTDGVNTVFFYNTKTHKVYRVERHTTTKLVEV